MKRFVVFMFLLLALTAFVGAPQRSETFPIIIQSNSSETAAEVVNAYGGQVNEQLAIINAVSADVSEVAYKAISEDARTVAIHADDAIEIAGVSRFRRWKAPEADFPEVIGADAAWDARVKGNNVGVAIVDSGISIFDWNRRSIVARYDALDHGTWWRDPNGHGTMMASIIGNSRRDSNGFIGIAPRVDFIDVRVLDAQGKGTYTDIIEGLTWILENKDEHNIRVVNLSLVGSVDSPYWADPINQAVEALWDAGIVVVAAAGNAGSDPMTIAAPGNDPYIITAGAFTDNFTPNDEADDYLTPFSGAGPTEVGFVKPDVIAPGAHILTMTRNSSVWARENRDSRIRGQYYQIAGTSSATAITSGVIALMLDENPEMTPNQVKYALMNSARPAVNEDGTLTWSIFQQGAGRINAEAAVLEPPQGEANVGMEIGTPYVGPVVYRDGEFQIVDANGDVLPEASGYAWSGSYAWAGGYAWAGTADDWQPPGPGRRSR